MHLNRCSCHGSLNSGATRMRVEIYAGSANKNTAGNHYSIAANVTPNIARMFAAHGRGRLQSNRHDNRCAM